jgi:hypothetical protein
MISVLTNFGPGFGPLVRTFDMARRIHQRLEIDTGEPVNILVPWVYGEDQLRILREESFGETYKRGKVLLSPAIGDALRPLLFSGESFNEELSVFLRIYKKQKKVFEDLLKSSLRVVDLDGNNLCLEPGKRLEVTRNPVISSNIEHSYYSSVAYNSSIFEELLEFEEVSGVDYKLLEKAVFPIREIEADFRLHFQPFPRCLSFKRKSQPSFKTERETPPLIPLPEVPTEQLDRGMYVSVSGIPGLSPLYEEVFRLPQTIFTNDRSRSFSPDRIFPPRCIAHPSVNRVFARAAWNTIWLANLTGTPLVCPGHAPEDHPEIFFNLKSVSDLNLAYIWDDRKASLSEFLNEVPYGKQEPPQVYEEIIEKFGTLDGLDYCVNIIVEDFLHAE